MTDMKIVVVLRVNREKLGLEERGVIDAALPLPAGDGRVTGAGNGVFWVTQAILFLGAFLLRRASNS